eukprot:TRINITY_DN12121_c0_g2_i1.p1 TRINITY_DN12121_c0_g2~~TRINITY_DN12121_c0_g2_i1.p1  ORF type:complete len:101 (+),score=36.48 TRINITY_DN12121_c0_g2_i1:59-361(+)
MAEQLFKDAVKYVQSIPKDGPVKPSNSDKLMFYALFKQATDGKCKTKAPSKMNLVARAKWDAWNKLGETSKEEAMKKYVAQLEKLNSNWKTDAVKLRSKL